MNDSNPSLLAAVRIDRRSGLIELRDQLAAAIDDPLKPAHTLAPIARQLQQVLKEIADLPDPNAPGPV
jgi:hypothetical protein